MFSTVYILRFTENDLLFTACCSRVAVSVLWFTVYGLRFMAAGLWLTVYGLRFTVFGLRLLDYGLRLTACGSRLTSYSLRLTAYVLRLADGGFADTLHVSILIVFLTVLQCSLRLSRIIRHPLFGHKGTKAVRAQASSTRASSFLLNRRLLMALIDFVASASDTVYLLNPACFLCQPDAPTQAIGMQTVIDTRDFNKERMCVSYNRFLIYDTA